MDIYTGCPKTTPSLPQLVIGYGFDKHMSANVIVG